MATLERLKPGQILYDVHGYQRGNTTMRAVGVWLVRVIEVDMERRRALVSWNSNSPEWRYERQISRYKVNDPRKKS